MSDNEKTKNETTKQNKFSIIDMLMIVMVVGVILTIVIPLRQSRTHERMVQHSLVEVKRIIEENEAYKLDDDRGWGEYAFNLLALNMTDLDTLYFTYSVTDTTVVATSRKLAQEEKSYYFDLRDRRYRVPEDSKDVIDPEWLP